MTTRLLIPAIVLLLTLALGILLGVSLSKPKTITETKVVEKTITKVDTTYIERTKVVPLTKYVPRLVHVVPDTVTKFVVMGKKNYMDTISVDSTMQIMYDITVHGDLEDLQLGYIDTRSDKVITKETTHYVSPKGVYLGGTLGVNNASLGVQYNKGSMVYGLNYNFLAPTRHQSVTLSVFKRVF